MSAAYSAVTGAIRISAMFASWTKRSFPAEPSAVLSADEAGQYG
jgi:hypothetical protein